MSKIIALKAREILDSRGIPTIEASIWLDTRHQAIASIPSGTSTGKYEAKEMRDEDPERFQGQGVLKAVSSVNTIIAPKLVGLDPTNQTEIDQLLINLDGTATKERLGANAILSASQVVCEVAAASINLPTYDYLIAKYALSQKPPVIPTPIFNIINGGKHGAGNLDFQEFHIIPAKNFDYHTALECGEEIYQQLGKVLARRGAIHSVGIEGGYAPNLFSNRDAIEVIVEATNETKYKLNRDVFLGLDIAATNFYQNNTYQIKDSAQPLTAEQIIEYYKQLNLAYHFIMLEDPLQEDDWEHWPISLHELEGTLIIGDDLLATNRTRLQKAIDLKACNAILIKPNQVGTISETVEVIRLAKKANLKIIVSHRSGETVDDFIADFAVGMGADYTKFGAPSRGERVTKYNRLLQIESEMVHKSNL